MPDLHDWITQQIDTAQQHADPWHDTECDIHATTLIDAVVLQSATLCDCGGPDTVLRRCEADRRILNRHRLDPSNYYEPACLGCRTYGDQEMAYTGNLNECPELLDLAHAHGITPQILATLDQPETPARPEQTDGGRGFQMPTALQEAMVRLAMIGVPPALRGPNWKARP
jgi:hypothetical protein